jgi:hypothetical protein
MVQILISKISIVDHGSITSQILRERELVGWTTKKTQGTTLDYQNYVLNF